MNELWRGQPDFELTQFDALSQQIADTEKRLGVVAENHEGINRLRTIPGVGPRTAEVIVTALDDVNRFKNARQVSSYIGLVPCQYQSGETDRNSRITKRGSQILRTILLECAWVSVQYNDCSRTTYDASRAARKHAGKKLQLLWTARSRTLA